MPSRHHRTSNYGITPRKGPTHPTLGGVLQPPLRGNAPTGGSSLSAGNKPINQTPVHGMTEATAGRLGGRR